MSRIHEALKKRDRERAIREGKREPTVPPPGSQEVLPTVIPTGPPKERVPFPASSPPPSSRPEQLIARFAQTVWKPQSKMLFFSGEWGLGDEEFRTLRSRLLQMREQRPLRKLLVSSALPNDGKSFVSANLTQVIACQPEQRALLIDADLRGGHLHDVLGTNFSPGLSDFLLNEADEFNIVQRGQMDNLFFLPCGRTVENPAELVANGRLKTLLNRLEPLFDWIIIDSPPAIPVSDATLLADYCDGVLLVVRSGVTDCDAVRRAREEFRDTQLVGTILNGVPPSSLPYYGTYGRTY